MNAARIVFFLFLAVFLSSTGLSKQDHSSELVTELHSLQSRSQTVLIHLDDDSVSRFLTSVPTPRPYSLVIFFDAAQLHSKSELEGFAVGLLYTLVGLLLAGITHRLIKVSNQMVQRLSMGIAMIVSFWAVSKVVQLDNWKTGYGIHVFWPSSWS